MPSLTYSILKIVPLWQIGLIIVDSKILHPLFKVPGPRPAFIGNFRQLYNATVDKECKDVAGMHRKYGPIVRAVINRRILLAPVIKRLMLPAFTPNALSDIEPTTYDSGLSLLTQKLQSHANASDGVDMMQMLKNMIFLDYKICKNRNKYCQTLNRREQHLVDILFPRNKYC
ncbi:hypothetical protein BDF19DRAFT_416838 [Syncephalis fuscata]|nr:hypothetical protein BDF19DRAFT_416838 [Syncephalis fuscata]